MTTGDVKAVGLLKTEPLNNLANTIMVEASGGRFTVNDAGWLVGPPSTEPSIRTLLSRVPVKKGYR